MTIAIIIILAVLFCIMVGFAARQMQDLRENATTIEKKDATIHDLRVTNEVLRRDKRDLTTSLEMVLADRDKSI